MALNWNIEKCKNYKQLGTEENWPVTNALIWATMACQMGEITEKNVDEFYRRLQETEKRGAWLTENGKPYYIPKAEVRKRIGLYTNVSTTPKKEFDAWMKRKAPVVAEA